MNTPAAPHQREHLGGDPAGRRAAPQMLRAPAVPGVVSARFPITGRGHTDATPTTESVLAVPAKQEHHTPPVPIRRWPESPPPATGGIEVHRRRPLAAQTHLTLELVRITAFDSGLSVHLTLTANGRPVVAARM